MGSARQTVMVSGGSGLLGSNCLIMLKSQCRVIGLYHTHRLTLPDVELWPVDLRERSAMATLVDGVKPDTFIHCAALTNVDYCEGHPEEARRMNGEVVGDLAALARRNGIRFVYISTDAVYDAPQGGSSETSPLRPVNVYASSKLAGEQAALQANPDSLIIRTCLYGWNAQNKLSFSEAILKALLLEEELALFQDVFFSPILVNDLVDVVGSLVAAGCSGIYNVGAGQGVSKLAFGTMLAEQSKLPSGQLRAISLAEKKLAAARPRNPVMNVDKVQEALQRPMPTVEQGLRRFLDLLGNGYVNNIKAGVGALSDLREVWRA